MQLYIMRHGQASHTGNSDAERQLTKQGCFEAEIMGKWLNTMQPDLSHLLVSPFIRAQQTSAVVQAMYNNTLQSTTCNMITPSGNASQVHDYIDGMLDGLIVSRFDGLSDHSEINKNHKDSEQALLVVSHMPLVSYLVEDLTVERNSPIFQTAGIAQIDYDVTRMKGQLVRLISPHDLC